MKPRASLAARRALGALLGALSLAGTTARAQNYLYEVDVNNPPVAATGVELSFAGTGGTINAVYPLSLNPIAGLPNNGWSDSFAAGRTNPYIANFTCGIYGITSLGGNWTYPIPVGGGPPPPPTPIPAANEELVAYPAQETSYQVLVTGAPAAGATGIELVFSQAGGAIAGVAGIKPGGQTLAGLTGNGWTATWNAPLAGGGTYRASFTCSYYGILPTANGVWTYPIPVGGGPPPPPTPIPAANVQLTEYGNQNSATTFYHSGICVQNGVVWDWQFAPMVRTAVQPGYNEMAFAFTECYGGGMIDELAAIPLRNVSYTSAARHDQPSWASTAANGPGNFYNSVYAPAAGGATVNTHLQAAMIGRAGDAFGPPSIYREIPQYTSDGLVGDAVTLHRNNPTAGQPPNTQYLAVLFGGSDAANDDGPINTTNVTTIQNALVARGYVLDADGEVGPPPPNANVYTVYAPGTGAQLLAAWNWAKGLTNPTTQVYFWSSSQHGDTMFDWVGYLVSQIGGAVQKAIPYAVPLDGNYIVKLQRQAALISDESSPGPLDGPFFEVDSAYPPGSNPSTEIGGLTVTINGVTLSSPTAIDLFGNGSQYEYFFPINTAQNLAELDLGSSNTVTFNYSGPAGALQFGGLSVGMVAGDLSVDDVSQGSGPTGPHADAPALPTWALGALALLLAASGVRWAARLSP